MQARTQVQEHGLGGLGIGGLTSGEQTHVEGARVLRAQPTLVDGNDPIMQRLATDLVGRK